jgi:hypothetical protein
MIKIFNWPTKIYLLFCRMKEIRDNGTVMRYKKAFGKTYVYAYGFAPIITPSPASSEGEGETKV